MIGSSGIVTDVFTDWRGVLEEPGRALLALHLRPDGDAVGSNLALARVLVASGHDVIVVSPHPPPRVFRFLPGFDRIVVMPIEEVAWGEVDVFWALDLSAPDMLGPATTFPPELDIRVIDHHHTNPGWGTRNLVDPAAPSTTALLTRLFQFWEVPLDSALATCLLTGLATDTGFFAYAATPAAFRTAADLIAQGADYQAIAFKVNQHVDVAVARAAGAALRDTQIFPGERLAVMTLPWQTGRRPRSGALIGLLTHQITTIAGIDLGAVLIEEAPGQIRIELRARTPGYDVSTIAVRLGGGGHRAASGARLSGTLDEAIAVIRQTVYQIHASEDSPPNDPHAASRPGTSGESAGS